MSVKVFGSFFNWLLSHCIFCLSLYQISDICLLQIFSHILWLVFSFYWHCLLQGEGLNFNQVWAINSFIMLLVLYLKNHGRTQGHLGFLLSYLGVLVVAFIVRSMIHFEFIFMQRVSSLCLDSCFCSYMDVHLFQHHLNLLAKDNANRMRRQATEREKRFSPLYCFCFFVKDK